MPTQLNPTNIHVAANPPPALPEIKAQYECATNALNDLRDQISALDEQLGYVSLSAPPELEGKSEPAQERSALAHNLFCLTADINRLGYRVQQMRLRLEI
jgi:hypothetical protein